MPAWQALTLSANGILRVIESACEVCTGFDPVADPQAAHPQWYGPFRAIWDTGATNSVITQKVVDDCGLLPTGMTITHGVHGEQAAETYLCNLRLPNGVAFSNIGVTKGSLGDAHILLGMDVISSGDFAVTNFEGRTVMSFRTPSTRCIDFVKEHREQAAHEQHGGSKRDRRKRAPKQFGKNKHHK